MPTAGSSHKADVVVNKSKREIVGLKSRDVA